MAQDPTNRHPSCCGVPVPWPFRSWTIKVPVMWLAFSICGVLGRCSQLIILANVWSYDPETTATFFFGEVKDLFRQYYSNHRIVATLVSALFIIGELTNVILSGLCLHAAVKKDPATRLLRWVHFNCACIAVSIPFTALISVWLGHKVSSAYGLVFFVGAMLVYAGNFYLIRAVYGYTKQLLERHGRYSVDGSGFSGSGGEEAGSGDRDCDGDEAEDEGGGQPEPHYPDVLENGVTLGWTATENVYKV